MAKEDPKLSRILRNLLVLLVNDDAVARPLTSVFVNFDQNSEFLYDPLDFSLNVSTDNRHLLENLLKPFNNLFVECRRERYLPLLLFAPIRKECIVDDHAGVVEFWYELCCCCEKGRVEKVNHVVSLEAAALRLHLFEYISLCEALATGGAAFEVVGRRGGGEPCCCRRSCWRCDACTRYCGSSSAGGGNSSNGGAVFVWWGCCVPHAIFNALRGGSIWLVAGNAIIVGGDANPIPTARRRCFDA